METPMIELTDTQAEAIADQPLIMVNPKTQEEFVLVRKDRFEAMEKWLSSVKRRWDDPANDNLILRK
jgi:hypothetical protein